MTETITGMGLMTPVGHGLAELFDALCTGRSGISRPPQGHPAEDSLEVGGFLPDIDPRTVLSGPDANTLDRIVVLALLAAEDALADAGIEVGRDVDPLRTAAIVGGGGRAGAPGDPGPAPAGAARPPG